MNDSVKYSDGDLIGINYLVEHDLLDEWMKYWRNKLIEEICEEKLIEKEREKMIEELIEEDIEDIRQALANEDYFFITAVLRGDGFKGYNLLTDKELKTEYKDRRGSINGKKIL